MFTIFTEHGAPVVTLDSRVKVFTNRETAEAVLERLTTEHPDMAFEIRLIELITL